MGIGIKWPEGIEKKIVRITRSGAIGVENIVHRHKNLYNGSSKGLLRQQNGVLLVVVTLLPIYHSNYAERNCFEWHADIHWKQGTSKNALNRGGWWFGRFFFSSVTHCCLADDVCGCTDITAEMENFISLKIDAQFSGINVCMHSVKRAVCRRFLQTGWKELQ